MSLGLQQLCSITRQSLSFLGIDAAKYGIIITPIIISCLPSQLALEWADVSNGKEGDLPHLLTFLQDYVALPLLRSPRASRLVNLL